MSGPLCRTSIAAIAVLGFTAALGCEESLHGPAPEPASQQAPRDPVHQQMTGRGTGPGVAGARRQAERFADDVEQEQRRRAEQFERGDLP